MLQMSVTTASSIACLGVGVAGSTKASAFGNLGGRCLDSVAGCKLMATSAATTIVTLVDNRRVFSTITQRSGGRSATLG